MNSTSDLSLNFHSIFSMPVRFLFANPEWLFRPTRQPNVPYDPDYTQPAVFPANIHLKHTPSHRNANSSEPLPHHRLCVLIHTNYSEYSKLSPDFSTEFCLVYHSYSPCVSNFIIHCMLKMDNFLSVVCIQSELHSIHRITFSCNTLIQIFFYRIINFSNL